LLKSRNQHVNTSACWSRIKPTENVINAVMSTSAAERKNFILKTQCFALILQKLLFHGHCYWEENTSK
jgi:hypothetical protein